jgi:hypothetical protein
MFSHDRDLAKYRYNTRRWMRRHRVVLPYRRSLHPGPDFAQVVCDAYNANRDGWTESELRAMWGDR